MRVSKAYWWASIPGSSYMQMCFMSALLVWRRWYTFRDDVIWFQRSSYCRTPGPSQGTPLVNRTDTRRSRLWPIRVWGHEVEVRNVTHPHIYTNILPKNTFRSAEITWRLIGWVWSVPFRGTMAHMISQSNPNEEKEDTFHTISVRAGRQGILVKKHPRF